MFILFIFLFPKAPYKYITGDNAAGFCKVFTLCIGPVLTTGWLKILFRVSSSSIISCVTSFCFPMSTEKISEYFTGKTDITYLVNKKKKKMVKETYESNKDSYFRMFL